jgi:hypothetical protein
MTPIEKYRNDLEGYLLIKRAMDADHVSRLLEGWDADLPNRKLFDISWSWREAWTSLIDNDALLGAMRVIIGDQIRHDHAFAVTDEFKSFEGRLHHHSRMHESGIFHDVHDGKFHSGLIGLSIALTEIEKDNGAFSCIPGSHKANFQLPTEGYDIHQQPLVCQVPKECGDIIVFSESLTHGSSPVVRPYRRRTAAEGGVAFERKLVDTVRGVETNRALP